MKWHQFVRPFSWSIFWGLFSLAGVACRPTTEVKSETWYSSPTWSLDDTQVAYIRSDVRFEAQRPRISLFVGEDSVSEQLLDLTMYLCINDRDASSERCLVEIPARNYDEKSAVIVNIDWREDGIFYAIRSPSQTHAEIRRIPIDSTVSELIDPRGSESAVLPRRVSGDSLELYAGSGGYGYFNDQTIYIFDHLNRTTGIYVSDPLSTEAPYIPPYSVTGR